MTMSIGGLVSGLDTSTLISQLLRAEAAPQTALKARLSATEAAASAYRSVNSRFDALRTAAEAVLKTDTWSAKKATSSAPSVTATAASTAMPGSLTFDVKNTAAAHVVIGASTYKTTGDSAGFAELEVLDSAGAVKGKITVAGAGTVADAVKAINDSTFGLSAAAVQVAPGSFKIQVTAEQTGTAARFDLRNPANLALLNPPDDFTTVTAGVDAKISVGTSAPYDITSVSNTFTDVMAGVTFTVSKPETGVTVTVASDREVAATKVQALVDAANEALSGIKTNTDPKGGASAVLKGDSALRNLTSGVLSAVSQAVGTDGSLAAAGLELKRDGTIVFDKATFLTALEKDPALVERLVVGTATTPGAAQRLHDLANKATDTATGTLILLAKGRDNLADDIQDKIEAWDLRLDRRREMLTRQFTAMEVALSSLRNQSNWLAGQLASLPSSK